MTAGRRIASGAPRCRRTGPGSGARVRRPGPAPGPAPPYPARWRRCRTTAARTRSAHPGPAARKGRRLAPCRSQAPGTGYHRSGRRGSPTWCAPACCATGAAARPGTHQPGSRAPRRRTRGRQRDRAGQRCARCRWACRHRGSGRGRSSAPRTCPCRTGALPATPLAAPQSRAGRGGSRRTPRPQS